MRNLSSQILAPKMKKIFTRLPLKWEKFKSQGLEGGVKRVKSLLFDHPQILSLDVSSRCNLKCRMCSLPQQKERGDMSWEIFSRLEMVFPRLSKVELYSSGEPLMNKELPQMLQRIKIISPQIWVEFFTNGLLIKEDILYHLIRSGLDRVTFSLDAATAKTYEKIRQGGNFAKVLRVIQLFNQAKKELSRKSPLLALAFVAMRDNISELPSLVRLAARHKIQHINVNGLEPYTEELKDQILYGENNEGYQEYFRKALHEAKRLKVYLDLPRLSLASTRFCPVSKLALISWKGEVLSCPILSYEKTFFYLGKKYHRAPVSFGSVKEKDFYDIWYSSSYKKFRQGLRRREFPPFCDKCLLSRGVICPIG